VLPGDGNVRRYGGTAITIYHRVEERMAPAALDSV
jgi:hypothetical protein